MHRSPTGELPDIFDLTDPCLEFSRSHLVDGEFVQAETENQKVEGVAGGGFCGKVLLCDEFVIKTTQPDTFHELLRGKKLGPTPISAP